MTSNDQNTRQKIHDDDNGYFVDFSDIEYDEYLKLSFHDNRDEIHDKRKVIKPLTTQDFLYVPQLTFSEEIIPTLLLVLGLPGAVFSWPIIFTTIGLAFNSLTVGLSVACIVLIPLAIMPLYRTDKTLKSWVVLQSLRYFSFKFYYEEKMHANKPYILVGPPHGVFPFGNIMSLLALPFMFGYSFRGLATSIAFRLPFFRQLLFSIGGIDASRESATKALMSNISVGISTGGVSEVFDTNSKTGDEVILLKERKGLVKLAIKTGASLLPCYLFGNTQLYSLWCGGDNGSSLHEILRKISRKLGFALILFWGRFYLPLPYRVPIVGVMGRPIHVEQNNNPSDEEVLKVHELLMNKMKEVFDKHKDKYGWSHKNLIIE